MSKAATTNNSVITEGTNAAGPRGGGTTHPTIMVGASKAATTNSAEATGAGYCNDPAIPVAATTTYAVVSRIGGTPHFDILVVAVESFISDVDDSLPFTLRQESDEGTTAEILLQNECTWHR